MSVKKVCLASDNWAPAHPLVLEALAKANIDVAAPYGADSWTEEASRIIQEAFKASAKVLMVPTGTGANVFALKLCCKRFESIICSDVAHIYVQESGAAESIVGCKLLTVPHQQGKLTPESISKKLIAERAFGKHATSPRVVSLAQTTEFGTVYSLNELKNISKLCKQENLLLHLDGSRLYNAAVALRAELYEIAQASLVDILSLGGTKNGLLSTEAVLIFNPALFEGSEHIHKQSLQLLSKMRYSSAQFIPYFKHKLWHELASNAHNKAQQIAAIIQNIPALKLNYPVQSNQIFFTCPPAWIPLIQEKITCLVWDVEKNELRFIASWFTTDEDVYNTRLILEHIATCS